MMQKAFGLLCLVAAIGVAIYAGSGWVIVFNPPQDPPLPGGLVGDIQMRSTWLSGLAIVLTGASLVLLTNAGVKQGKHA